MNYWKSRLDGTDHVNRFPFARQVLNMDVDHVPIVRPVWGFVAESQAEAIPYLSRLGMQVYCGYCSIESI